MLKFNNPFAEPEESPMDAALVVDNYANNGRLFIGLWTMDEEIGGMTPWCDVTVNLPFDSLTDENCVFIDVNDAPYLQSFLTENGLAAPTGRKVRSGFVEYPEFRIDLNKILQHRMVPTF